MAPNAPPSAAPLIAERFAIDFAHPLPGAGGGLPAFMASDRREGRTGLMAVQARRYLPPRADALRALGNAQTEGLLTPLAYGAARMPGGEEAGFLICPAPPGPALSAQPRQWPEAELLSRVLRPAARALDQLAQHRLTHRAIRADNVFRAGPGYPAVLGCAWATPPAALQPAVVEPPYVAMCPPAGRGSGAIADDVYALGVLLLTLALGRSPLAGLDDTEIVRQKLDTGSHAALIGDHRVSSFLGDLLRGMLAEDPEHRPPPSLLLDSTAARSRRIAARPPHRAPRPIELGGLVCWHARSLAHALAANPEQGLRALQVGMIAHWLRRGLGDGALASRLEDQVGIRPDARADEPQAGDSLALMRAVALLDPLAPLCWDGLAIWPDGLGPMLAFARDPTVPAGREIAGRIGALVTAEAQVAWGRLRPERCDVALLRVEARQLSALLRGNGQAGGILRLLFHLNPLLPCLGSGLDGRWVIQLAELLAALEAGTRRESGAAAPIGAEVAAFIAARGDGKLETEAARLGAADNPDGPIIQLRLLARLQARSPSRKLPGLGAWFAGQAETLLAQWKSRQRRAALLPRLRELAERGELVALLVLLEDNQAHRSDDREARLAAEELSRIDAELAQIAGAGPARAEQARRLGEEIAAGLGLAALAVLLLTAAFG